MKGFYGKPPAPVNAKIAKKSLVMKKLLLVDPTDLLEDEFDKYKNRRGTKRFCQI